MNMCGFYKKVWIFIILCTDDHHHDCRIFLLPGLAVEQFVSWMMQHASPGPALPSPPGPWSSVPFLSTTDLPITLCSPISVTSLSVLCHLIVPLASTIALPRSPMWRCSESGPPWSVSNGLKWPPRFPQPPSKDSIAVSSVPSCMWNPCPPDRRCGISCARRVISVSAVSTLYVKKTCPYTESA